jgi:hypothetical protein
VNKPWVYSDHNFLGFVHNIGKIVNQQSLIWQTRDAIFYSFSYGSGTAKTHKRDCLGLFTWIAWLFHFILFSKKTDLPKTNITSANHYFLFCDPNPSHFETLDALLSDHFVKDISLCWTIGLTPSQNKRLRQYKHTIVIDCAGFTPDFWSRATGGLRAISLTLKALIICTLALKSPPPFARWSKLADFFLQYFLWQDFWGMVQTNHNINAKFYVTSEASAVNKAFVARARRSRLQVYHYCHGLAHAAHQVSNATDLVAFNDIDANWFRASIPSQTKVHSSGNPRLKRLATNVGRPRSRKPGDPLHLLYFAQVVETPYTSAQRMEDFALLDVNNFFGSNIVLRIRPHPRDSVNSLCEDLQLSGVFRYELSSNSLEDDLIWSDICASSWSTANLDAIACGRPTYWLNARNDRFAMSGAMIDAGIGSLITTPLQFKEELWKYTKLQS